MSDTIHVRVRVVPDAKEERVTEEDDCFAIHTTASAREGKANSRICRLLQSYLDLPDAHLRIVNGHTNTKKIIAIHKPESAS